jgi:hypothetical protein
VGVGTRTALCQNGTCCTFPFAETRRSTSNGRDRCVPCRTSCVILQDLLSATSEYGYPHVRSMSILEHNIDTGFHNISSEYIVTGLNEVAITW